MLRALFIASGLLIAGLGSPFAFAQEPESCKTVRLGSGGWTDNVVQDALAMNVLAGLGYEATETELGLNVLVEALKNKDVDIHFDYWSPSSDSLMKPYLDEKSIEIVTANLTDSKYTLAVPAYAWEAGLKDFADLAKFKGELKGKIYGQSAGSDSNMLVLDMIQKNAFGLGGFELIESSEQGMLSQVDRAITAKEFIAFVGWAPHPMNSKYAMKYLSGGDDYFGPNFGSATIYTIVTSGLIERCPNLGTLLKNIKFSVDMENELMLEVLEKSADAKAAAKAWLNRNPSTLDSWLKDVTTRDGKPGLAAVKAHLAQ
ncbi:MAG: choline ABC transporter substrate-binding protein [Parvibaculaceae bacterium]